MVNQNSNYMESTHKITREKALEIFVDELLRLHPKESWPSWFTSYTDLTEIPTDNPSEYKLAIAALQKKVLGPNEWYEEIDGKEVLTKLIPGTDEKGYVINTHESDMVIIFEASIDLETSRLRVLTDRDLSLFSSEDLRKIR